MFTADTITDEQIRALRDEEGTDLKRYIICSIALDENPDGNPVEDRGAIVAAARSRCAVILNNRTAPTAPTHEDAERMGGG